MEMYVKKYMVMRISRQPSPVHITRSKKKLDNVEYFNYLDSLVTNAARCTCEIKSRIAIAKQHSTRRLFKSNFDLNLWKN